LAKEQSEPIPSILIEEEITEGSEPKKIKVYSDIDGLDKMLTHKSFEVVKEPENADVLWMVTNLEYLKQQKEK
jgi:hypothetical protein